MRNRASILHKEPENTVPEDNVVPEEVRRAAAVLSKFGSDKGGQARASSMTPKQRTALAKKAARARWRGKREEKA
jgi:hypothetical protein